MRVSIVIPTYGREQCLLDTVRAVLPQVDCGDELLIVDQTVTHTEQTERTLRQFEAGKSLRLIRLERPSTVMAMNIGLLTATGDVLLFLDDDILLSPSLVSRHRALHADKPEAWAVVGRIVQPEVGPEGRREERHGGAGVLRRDVGFQFDGFVGAWVENVMAGNLSVKRGQALAVGGFDENFIPPVSYRFETEFAKRIVRTGGKIWFEPSASIRHLRAPSGGTRSIDSHLTSASPLHGVGDYYYALRCGEGWDRFWYMARRPFREVRTRFHLRHPWYIPFKFAGELRAMALAFRLHRQGPKLMNRNDSDNRGAPC